MEEQQSFLDKLVGAEGLKTDIKVTLSTTTYVYIAVALFVGITGALVVGKAITNK